MSVSMLVSAMGSLYVGALVLSMQHKMRVIAMILKR